METEKQVLGEFEAKYIPLIDKFLSENIVKSSTNKLLIDSMSYSLMAGGKRLRPLLSLAVLDSYGVAINQELIKVISAVELIHTYSLIHDDLPAMDNSDYRRGKLANHVKFGDDIATLAGDGLLTLAFEWIADSSLNSAVKVDLISQLARSAGPCGMVAGQVIDVSSEDSSLTLEQLQTLDQKKTGELFYYCVVAGAMIAKVSDHDLKQLKKFAWSFGVAFQIYDDILDNPATGSDEDVEKNTYVNLLGIENAKDKLAEIIKQGENAVDNLEDAKVTVILKSFFTYFEIGKR